MSKEISTKPTEPTLRKCFRCREMFDMGYYETSNDPYGCSYSWTPKYWKMQCDLCVEELKQEEEDEDEQIRQRFREQRGVNDGIK